MNRGERLQEEARRKAAAKKGNYKWVTRGNDREGYYRTKVAKKGYEKVKGRNFDRRGEYVFQKIAEKAKSKKKKKLNADEKLASITNKDFKNYKKDFLPVEKAVIKDIKGQQAEKQAARRAKKEMTKALEHGQGVLRRGISRTGATLEDDVRQQHNFQRGLSDKASTAGAMNLARRAQSAEDDATRQELIQAGHGLKGQALQGLGAAATMEGQRDAAGDAMAAQKKSQMMSNVGTGASVGMMAGMQAGSVGGPWGAAIGAGVGLLASMF